MVEDLARAVHVAREAGPLIPKPQESVDRLSNRYQTSRAKPPAPDDDHGWDGADHT